MIESIDSDWVGNMAFDSDVNGHTIHFDADKQDGGTFRGPSPKPVVLAALAACTGMDVVSILRKKRVPFTAFRISVSSETAEEHPKIYTKIHLTHILSGPGFAGNAEIMEKMKRSVTLSRDNYCPVSAMLKNSCEITDEIRLLDS